MKIAMFTDVFLDVIGGIRTSIEAQKQDLERLGHEVYIFCPGREKSEDPKMRIVPTSFWWSLPGVPIAKWPKKVMKYVRKELAELGVDVVHVHYELSSSISGMKVAREMGLPVVQTMHGREDVAIEKNLWPGVNTFASWVFRRVHARLILHKIRVKRDNYLARSRTARNMWEIMVNHAQYADYVVFPSRHFEKKFVHYGLTKPAEVVSNGIEDAMIEGLGKLQPRKMKAGEKLKIIWFSRMSNEKRPMEFLEAVRKSGVPVRLEMYGDGVLEDKARRYVTIRKMRDVHVRGRAEHEEILEKIQWAHIAILNSVGFDNQPMTLLEGVATGLPVLLVDPDMKEVVPEGGYVFVSSPDVEDMAAALKDLSEHPEKISKMSRSVMIKREDALQSRQTDKLLKIYKKVRK